MYSFAALASIWLASRSLTRKSTCSVMLVSLPLEWARLLGCRPLRLPLLLFVRVSLLLGRANFLGEILLVRFRFCRFFFLLAFFHFLFAVFICIRFKYGLLSKYNVLTKHAY